LGCFILLFKIEVLDNQGKAFTVIGVEASNIEFFEAKDTRFYSGIVQSSNIR
jgi:hypothetical protein